MPENNSSTVCENEQEHIIVLDSKQRDYSKWKTASEFELNPNIHLRNIKQIALKAVCIPKTEYNVNDSNKYIDFIVGDQFTFIEIHHSHRRKPVIMHNGNTHVPSTDTIQAVDPTGSDARFVHEVDSDGAISHIIIKHGGRGYSQHCGMYLHIPGSNHTKEFFNFRIGTHFTAILRDGEYSVGGNPVQSNYTGTSSQMSWVPTNLLAEIESAMSYAILKKDAPGLPPQSIHWDLIWAIYNLGTGLAPRGEANAENWCYGRVSCHQGKDPASGLTPPDPVNSKDEAGRNDYPELFSARIMSKFPDVEAYEYAYEVDQRDSRDNRDHYECNSCKFTRIWLTSSLIFRVTPRGATPFEIGLSYLAGPVGGPQFKVIILRMDIIPTDDGSIPPFPLGFVDDVIIYCALDNALPTIGSTYPGGAEPGTYWTGNADSTILAANNFQLPAIYGKWDHVPWELQFGTGEHKRLSAATILGYNRKDYCPAILTKNVSIKHHLFALSGAPPPYTSSAEFTTLIAQGYTIAAENDYYLGDSSEYIGLSLTINDNQVEKINATDSTVDRLFALLFFDGVPTSCLKDLSSGKTTTKVNSFGVDIAFAATHMHALHCYHDTSVIAANVGYLQSVSSASAVPKIVKEGREVINYYPQHLPRIDNIHIKFLKCNHIILHNDEQKINLHGRDALIVLKITTHSKLNIDLPCHINTYSGDMLSH